MPFKRIMKELVDEIPGATGAIFVDWEGEAVDQFGPVEEDYQLKVIGAYKGVILNMINEAQKATANDSVTKITLRMKNYNVIIAPVKEGYSVIMIADHEAILSKANFRIDKAVNDLLLEM